MKQRTRCWECEGTGTVRTAKLSLRGAKVVIEACADCDGTGWMEWEKPTVWYEYVEGEWLWMCNMDGCCLGSRVGLPTASDACDEAAKHMRRYHG